MGKDESAPKYQKLMLLRKGICMHAIKVPGKFTSVRRKYELLIFTKVAEEARKL